MKTRVRTKYPYNPDSYLKMSTGIKLWVLWSIITWTIIAILAKNVTWFLFMVLFLNAPILFFYFLYIIWKFIISINSKIKKITNSFQKSNLPMIEPGSLMQRKNNHNYYHIKKLKRDFSKYLFWKYFRASCLIFCNTYFISLFILIYFLQNHKDTVTIMTILFFPFILWIIWGLSWMNRYFLYKTQKDKIKFNIYSWQPNAYYWSPNWYIDFFRKK